MSGSIKREPKRYTQEYKAEAVKLDIYYSDFLQYSIDKLVML